MRRVRSIVSGKRLARGLALLSTAGMLAGCAAGGATVPMRIDVPGVLGSPDDHRQARAWLRQKRVDMPTHAVGWNVTARFVDERTKLAQSGRGALAVRPPDALRMQLVGPAGKLALDVWLGPTGGRLSSPMMGASERTAPGEHRPGRPTGFLAWWMLQRFEGRLLAVERVGAERRLIVRTPSGEIVTFVHEEGAGGERLRATRRTAGDEERVSHEGAFCGHSLYASARARISVDVVCGEATPEPRARAFEDPDLPP